MPVLDKFKYKVVDQVLKNCPDLNAEQVYLCLSPLKGKLGVGLNFRQLKLGGVQEITDGLFKKVLHLLIITLVQNRQRYY